MFELSFESFSITLLTDFAVQSKAVLDRHFSFSAFEVATGVECPYFGSPENSWSHVNLVFPFETFLAKFRSVPNDLSLDNCNFRKTIKYSYR